MSSATFQELGLPAAMGDSLSSFGYESPSPIQAEAIPYLLEGRDIIGQAQTGTGKTAAFALPLLAKIDPKLKSPQVLVLTPTRELAIQVAESFQKYARSIDGFHVLPIYGGQAYQHQLRPLKRGVHVVVGTPGRVTDHLRKKTLKLDHLQCLVLDEADEMLRMGFIDDVNWVLEQTPEQRQIALFSATMPTAIKKIAATYLNNPAEVKIKVKQTTADNINQRYQVVSGRRKIDALSRILEVETGDAMLIFVRTKNATSIVAEQLTARGFTASALNGDLAQAQREKIIQHLKSGKIDIIVATDVAARGLDVPRISHVINFDAPQDPESYVHRIGRTGRFGNTGEAILFITPREKRFLQLLGRATKAEIKPMAMPTTDEVNAQRIDKFKERISQVIADGKLEFNNRLIDSFLTDHPEVSANEVAAALATIVQGGKPLLISKEESFSEERFDQRPGRDRDSRHEGRGRNSRHESGGRDSRHERGDRHSKRERNDREPRHGKERNPKITQTTEKGMETFRIEVGHRNEVRPAMIVAAIANTAGLQGKHIGRIEIYEGFSTVDLPEGMPSDVFQDLERAKVGSRPMSISKVGKR